MPAPRAPSIFRTQPLRLAVWCAFALALAISTWWGQTPGQAGLEDFQRLEVLAEQRYGRETAEFVRRWRNLLADLAGEDEQTQIERVNEFFNRNIRYQDDQVTWGQEDYWGTPLETLNKAAGDCEDFSILKYASLRKLGIPDERLRLFYVNARIGGPGSPLSQAHMVLGYFAEPRGEPLVLDNLVTRIEAASRRDDLTPIFSFNSEGLWPDGAERSAADPTARLSRWRRVVEEMDADGLNLNRPITATSE